MKDEVLDNLIKRGNIKDYQYYPKYVYKSLYGIEQIENEVLIIEFNDGNILRIDTHWSEDGSGIWLVNHKEE